MELVSGLIFLILVLCSSVTCNDCVTYEFEDNYEDAFSNLVGVCSGMAFWDIRNYTDIPMASPNARSFSYIAPLEQLSCISSFTFEMESGGVVELNIFMESEVQTDQITLLCHQIGGNDPVVGSASNSPIQNPFIPGWHTLRATMTATGSFTGYISLMGQADANSIVLVDSFRYIPPNMEEELCELYEEEIEETTPDITTPEEEATTLPYTDDTTSPDIEEEATTLPDTDGGETTSPDIDFTTEPDIDEWTTTSPDIDEIATTLPDTEDTTSPDIEEEPTTLPDIEDTTSPDIEEEATTLPDIEEETTTLPDTDGGETTAPDTEETTSPDIDEETTPTPETEDTTSPDIEEEATTSPDTDDTTSPDIEEEATTLPETDELATTTSDPDYTTSPDIELETTTSPDIEEEATTLPDIEYTTSPDIDEVVTTQPDTDGGETTSPDTDGEVSTTPETDDTTSPDVDQGTTTPSTEGTTSTDIDGGETTPDIDAIVTTSPDTGETTPVDTVEPTTEDPVIIVPHDDSIWTPLLIGIVVFFSLLIVALLCFAFYQLGRWRYAKDEPIDFDYDLPKPITVPRVKKIYTNINPYDKSYSYMP